jgi:hypothetical protein
MLNARAALAPLLFVASLAACTASQGESDRAKSAKAPLSDSRATRAAPPSNGVERSSPMGTAGEPGAWAGAVDGPPDVANAAGIATGVTSSTGTSAQGTDATPNGVNARDARGGASGPSANSARDSSTTDLSMTEEPIYFPGARPKPRGTAVEASLDDETIARWNRGGLGTDADLNSKGRPLHAAPRVKVDVTEVRGSASEAEIQRAARLKSYWPFRICYEQGLRRTQKLHGTIKLRLTLGPSGRPSNVQQVAIELGDADVVSCVVKSAMGLGLPAPASGAPQVTLDISLWPGDAPVGAKTALRRKGAAPADAPSIAEALRTRSTEIRACYAAGLARHDKLWGRLGLSLTIAGGTVREADETESHFPDPEVTACVRKALLGIAVPKVDELVVVYPLRFGRVPDASSAQR